MSTPEAAAEQKFCPIANICQITSENGPPCGEDPAHLPPFILAEDMCLRALAGKRDEENTAVAEMLPPQVSKKYTRVAWLELEQGMATPDNAVATRHFDNSLEYADKAKHSPYVQFKDILPAVILHLYQPTFIARRNGETSTPQEQAVLRQGLGTLYDVLATAPVHVPQSIHLVDALNSGEPHEPCLTEGDRKGFAAKLVGMMLAARQNIFLSPASLRESNASGGLTTQNHDGYMLDNGQKVPVKIRIKRQANARSGVQYAPYDHRITYINMAQVVSHTLKKMRLNQKYTRFSKALFAEYSGSPSLMDVGDMLRKEIAGQELTPAQFVLLEGMTARFTKALSEGQRVQRIRSTMLNTETTESTKT